MRQGLSILELSLYGVPPRIDLDHPDLMRLSTAQRIDFFLWCFAYLCFIMLTVVLMLNLLIALLAFTFEAVKSESTLRCRIAFAQCLMRLELLATSFGMDVRVGDKKGDKYTYDFRSFEADDAGSSGGGTGYDPFAIPDGGPIVRVESKVDQLEKLHVGLAAKVDQLVQLLTPAAATDDALVNDPPATPSWEKPEGGSPG